MEQLEGYFSGALPYSGQFEFRTDTSTIWGKCGRTTANAINKSLYSNCLISLVPSYPNDSLDEILPLPDSDKGLPIFHIHDCQR